MANPKECAVGQGKVEYLGTTWEAARCILRWRIAFVSCPETKKEVRWFYYRQFVPGFKNHYKHYKLPRAVTGVTVILVRK